ncbi:hypothetical protein [Granulibacter bethesdensis]|uniref:hypothetical protein n=1 Tax=Granulibacter bethesdensis TaxID=364410 RepID=UPI0012DB46C4|nr:hypothetical protein [Granulibacter bethesdensis]
MAVRHDGPPMQGRQDTARKEKKKMENAASGWPSQQGTQEGARAASYLIRRRDRVEMD